MVSTTLYNRSEVTQRLAILISYVDKQDWRNAKFSSDSLLNSLLKYYNTRCIPANHFYELFERLNYMLIYCLPGNFKKQSVWDELNNIIKEIKTSTKNPIDRIREIMGDVRHLYYNISNENIPEIESCFEELDQLKSEMELIGGAVYNFYTQMMGAVGECESMMLRINQTTKTDSLFTSLESKFSVLFQMSHKVLAPPITIPITKEQVYQAIQEGAKIEDIAQGTAMSDEALRAMLTSAEMEHVSENE